MEKVTQTENDVHSVERAMEVSASAISNPTVSAAESLIRENHDASVEKSTEPSPPALNNSGTFVSMENAVQTDHVASMDSATQTEDNGESTGGKSTYSSASELKGSESTSIDDHGLSLLAKKERPDNNNNSSMNNQSSNVNSGLKKRIHGHSGTGKTRASTPTSSSPLIVDNFLAHANRVRNVVKLDDRTIAAAQFELIFAIVWQLDVVHHAQFRRPTVGFKCAERAEQYRRYGDRCMTTDAAWKLTALPSYNMSVLSSPMPPDDHSDVTLRLPTPLSAAYNSRSVCLYKLELYHQCMYDVQQTMRYGCADEQLSELFERQGLCCQKLNEFDRALQCFREASDVCGDAEQRRRLATRMRKMKRRMKSDPNFNQKSLLTDNFDPVPWLPAPPLLNGPNPEFPAVSSSLTAKRKDDGETTFIASSHISPGAVLLVESPFVFGAKEMEVYCHGCARKISIEMPCRNCVLVSYCSESCETESWKGGHRFECPILPYVFAGTSPGRVDHSILALILKTLVKLLLVPGGSTGEMQSSLDSGEFEPLSGMASVVKFRPSAIITIATYACLLIKLLRDKSEIDVQKVFSNRLQLRRIAKSLTSIHSKMIFQSATAQPLKQKGSKQLNPRLEFADNYLGMIIGGALIRLFLIYSPRHRSVCDTAILSAPPNNLSTVAGYGIFPTVSLLQHSCYPNVDIAFHGTTAVARAIRSIRIGQEVVCNYGTRFPHATHEQRKLYMQRFLIDCQCEVCAVHFEKCDQKSNAALFACPQCRFAVHSATRLGKCPGCRHRIGRDLETFRNRWKSIYTATARPKQTSGRHKYAPLYDIILNADRMKTFLADFTAADVATVDPFKYTYHACAMFCVITNFRLNGQTHYYRDAAQAGDCSRFKALAANQVDKIVIVAPLNDRALTSGSPDELEEQPSSKSSRDSKSNTAIPAQDPFGGELESTDGKSETAIPAQDSVEVELESYCEEVKEASDTEIDDWVRCSKEQIKSRTRIQAKRRVQQKQPIGSVSSETQTDECSTADDPVTEMHQYTSDASVSREQQDKKSETEVNLDLFQVSDDDEDFVASQRLLGTGDNLKIEAVEIATKCENELKHPATEQANAHSSTEPHGAKSDFKRLASNVCHTVPCSKMDNVGHETSSETNNKETTEFDPWNFKITIEGKQNPEKGISAKRETFSNSVKGQPSETESARTQLGAGDGIQVSADKTHLPPKSVSQNSKEAVKASINKSLKNENEHKNLKESMVKIVNPTTTETAKNVAKEPPPKRKMSTPEMALSKIFVKDTIEQTSVTAKPDSQEKSKRKKKTKGTSEQSTVTAQLDSKKKSKKKKKAMADEESLPHTSDDSQNASKPLNGIEQTSVVAKTSRKESGKSNKESVVGAGRESPKSCKESVIGAGRESPKSNKDSAGGVRRLKLKSSSGAESRPRAGAEVEVSPAPSSDTGRRISSGGKRNNTGSSEVPNSNPDTTCRRDVKASKTFENQNKKTRGEKEMSESTNREESVRVKLLSSHGIGLRILPKLDNNNEVPGRQVIVEKLRQPASIIAVAGNNTSDQVRETDKISNKDDAATVDEAEREEEWSVVVTNRRRKHQVPLKSCREDHGSRMNKANQGSKMMKKEDQGSKMMKKIDQGSKIMMEEDHGSAMKREDHGSNKKKTVLNSERTTRVNIKQANSETINPSTKQRNLQTSTSKKQNVTIEVGGGGCGNNDISTNQPTKNIAREQKCFQKSHLQSARELQQVKLDHSVTSVSSCGKEAFGATEIRPSHVQKPFSDKCQPRSAQNFSAFEVKRNRNEIVANKEIIALGIKSSKCKVSVEYKSAESFRCSSFGSSSLDSGYEASLVDRELTFDFKEKPSETHQDPFDERKEKCVTGDERNAGEEKKFAVKEERDTVEKQATPEEAEEIEEEWSLVAHKARRKKGQIPPSPFKVSGGLKKRVLR